MPKGDKDIWKLRRPLLHWPYCISIGSHCSQLYLYLERSQIHQKYSIGCLDSDDCWILSSRAIGSITCCDGDVRRHLHSTAVDSPDLLLSWARTNAHSVNYLVIWTSVDMLKRTDDFESIPCWLRIVVYILGYCRTWCEEVCLAKCYNLGKQFRLKISFVLLLC
jgi:hypothetical protein